MSSTEFTDHRPPPALWPDRRYVLPELQYADTINLADELIGRHVRGGGASRVAIVSGDTRVTYAELEHLVDRVGSGLQALGVEPRDRVLLRMPNRLEFAATWLALQKIGAVAVSTMPMLKAREIAYVIDDCEARLVVVDAQLRPELDRALDEAAGRPDVVSVGVAPGGETTGPTFDAIVDAGTVGLEPYPTPRDAVAIIAYTSGSTGIPKGACHAPVDIVASADSYARHVLTPSPADVFGGHPTLAFTFGLGGLLVYPLRHGSATVLLDRFTPERLLGLVGQEGISVLFCAATTYKLLLQDPELERRYDFGSLRLCVSAGEPLPRPVYEEWTARTGVELLDSLGTTELFHVFVCQQPGKVRPGATGLAVPGYEARIVDAQLVELPRGTPGLLAVRGPTGCRYWKKPDRQREYVRDGWNVPNDVCVQDEDGYFWYQCRNDDLIICAGYNIAGPEVESVLLEHASVLEVAVVASPDTLKGHVPKAFVVLKPGTTGDEALATELQEHVKRQIAPYKYPRRVEFVESLPKTETGKIKRVELRSREQAAGGSSCPPVYDT